MENDKIRSFEEEFWHQVNNDLCGGDFCINPDCYCDAFPRDVIERAAKRLFVGAEIVEPGVQTLESWRERVRSNPDDYVTDEDRLRCEWYAEAGSHYNEKGEPTCNDPVTTAVFLKEPADVFYSCDAHAPEFAQDPGFIRMEPVRPLSKEANNA